MGRMTRSPRLVCLVALIVVSGAAPLASAGGNTWLVPGDADTIQGAIDLASDSDTILVAPGVYREAIDYLGKTVAIVATDGAAATVLDAAGEMRSAVTIVGPGFGFALEGFTVTGGSTVSHVSSHGGGLVASGDANVTVRRCVFQSNHATNGGGVGIPPPSFLPGYTSLRLFDCVLRDNSATRGGGAWATDGQIHLEGCLVEGNQAVDVGGGFGSISSGKVYAKDCLIAGNLATDGGGSYGNNLIWDCRFERNRATGSGGGCWSTAVSISGTVFLDNSAGSRGGGLVAQSAPIQVVQVRRCIFAHNSAGEGGDGMYALFSSPWWSNAHSVIQCTFDGNGILTDDEPLTVRSSILRRTVAPLTLGGGADVTFSNVEGTWPGAGNIDADPRWIDAAAGAYGLLATSPCIDTGDPLLPPDADGSVSDMGALSASPWCIVGRRLHGSFGLPVLAGEGSLGVGTAFSLVLSRALPGGRVLRVLGADALMLPFKGGVLVPTPIAVDSSLSVDGDGTAVLLTSTWPASVPSETVIFVQCWIPDPGAAFGWAASNGLAVAAP